MLTVLAGLILVVAAQDEDPTQDYAKLYQALITAESYSFEVVVETTGGPMRRGGRGGQGGAPEPTKTVGKYQKEKPYLVKSGETEAYRLDDMMVYREAEGEWKLYDPEELMNSFRNRRDRDGGRGESRGGRPSEQDMIERFDADGDGALSDEERATARETLQKERAESGEGDRAQRDQRDQGRSRFGGMRALMELSRSTLPHETVQKLIGQVTDITNKSEVEDNVYFKGTLTAEGAKTLGSRISPFGRRGGFGGEAPEFDYSGDVELIITAEGAIEKIVITTKMSGEMMGRTFDSTRKTTIMVGDLGKAEMEVPEEAMALFVI